MKKKMKRACGMYPFFAVDTCFAFDGYIIAERRRDFF